jgi:small conductance mechanosensitive channel
MIEFWKSIQLRLQEIFDPTMLGAKFADWLADFAVGLIVLAFFYFVWRLLNWVLQRVLKKRNIDRTIATFIGMLLKSVVLVIGLITALDAAGIQISALLASLGIAGLTIGFAAQDALSNIVSGLLIFLDRPFVIGDLVEVEGQYGRVADITLRSTRIVTSDGKMLAVPNTQVINKTVASYTNFPHLRLDIAITVAVTEDLNQVRQVLLGLVRDNPVYLTEPAPRVVVTQLNDYNVAIEFQVWIKNEREHVERRFELRERAFNALNQAGIEMPFETIQLAPLEIKSHGKVALD